MGLPSTNIEAVYRNPIDEVAKFFNTMHGGHYLITNLCSEREYPTEKFQGRVTRFPFDDHNPCPLSTMVEFCAYVHDFLSQDKENIVAVHCKGGKGRTGTMCCAFLLFSKPEMYAEQALKLFATYRTAQDIGGKLQGVSGPSQKRYIGYFEQLRFVANKQDTFLTDALTHLKAQPPMELTTLTLNHVAPLKARARLAGEKANDKARDVHNTTWNQSKNWSLLITHYPPLATVDDEASKDNGGAAGSSSSAASLHEPEEDPAHWSAAKMNARMQSRYSDTKEFVFPAREKEISSEDDSVTFDMSSFHTGAKSLMLSGDLKFQIFRGNLDSVNSPSGVDGAASAAAAAGSDLNSPSAAGGVSAHVENKPFVYCWFWLNTACINSSSNRLILRKEQIDEVAKDSKVDSEMNLQLDYFSPPRAESWAHAPHPTFHLIPSKAPLSPRTEKKTPQQIAEEAELAEAAARLAEEDEE